MEKAKSKTGFAFFVGIQFAKDKRLKIAICQSAQLKDVCLSSFYDWH
jgi:hypothetical protein